MFKYTIHPIPEATPICELNIYENELIVSVSYSVLHNMTGGAFSKFNDGYLSRSGSMFYSKTDLLTFLYHVYNVIEDMKMNFNTSKDCAFMPRKCDNSCKAYLNGICNRLLNKGV
jgi:hypothetical protein